jgi:O-acetyl-ADP-ribose deacetylase (regulator of RNase III)
MAVPSSDAQNAPFSEAASQKRTPLPVFVSFARAELDAVNQLRVALAPAIELGWVDFANVGSRKRWDMAIQAAMQDSSIVLFIASPDSVRSDLCRAELRLATNLGRRIILLTLGLIPRDSLPAEARGLTPYDMPVSGDMAGWARKELMPLLTPNETSVNPSPNAPQSKAGREDAITADDLSSLSARELLAFGARALLRALPTYQPVDDPAEPFVRLNIEAVISCAWLGGYSAFVGSVGGTPRTVQMLQSGQALLHKKVGEQGHGFLRAVITVAELAESVLGAEDTRVEDAVVQAIAAIPRSASTPEDRSLLDLTERERHSDFLSLNGSRGLAELAAEPLWRDPKGIGAWYDRLEKWRSMLQSLELDQSFDRYMQIVNGGFDWETVFQWLALSKESEAAPQSQQQQRRPLDAVVLFERGGTRIGALVHNQMWTLGFDSIVIPATADGGHTGEIAAGVFEFLGPTARDNVTAAMSAGRLTPTTPVRALLDSAAVRPRGPTSIIVATAAGPDFTVQNAGRAAVAIAKCAADNRVATVAIPLLGTGYGRLDAKAVLEQMVLSLANAVPLAGVTDIVLVMINPELRAEAERFAATLPALLSMPERAAYNNDLYTKEDSLNVREQARTFAKLLAAKDTHMPLSLGLFGNWGAGKSYFLKLMRDAVDEMTARGAQPGSPYLRRIAQIDFNAWNYVDADLWASLAMRLFDGLAREYAGTQTEDKIEVIRRELQSVTQSSERARQEASKRQEKAKVERQQASEQLASLEAQRASTARTYGKAFWTRFLAAPGNQARLEEAKKLARKLGLGDAVDTGDDLSKLYQQVNELRGRWEVLLRAAGARFSGIGQAFLALGVIAVVGAVVYLVGARIQTIAIPWAKLAAWIARGATLISAATVWVGKQLGNVNKATTELESLRSDFQAADPLALEAGPEELELRQKLRALEAEIRTEQEKMAEAERRISTAQEELQRINAGGLVYDFAVGRQSAAEYTSKLGIVSVIREDFTRLRALLDDWGRHHPTDQAPIERIILYIDDLDRCHPRKVVDVLQAVHLLLAFDLFAVVVAVDPRWLERSLYKAYAPEVDRAIDGSPTRGSEFSPQNYLEKIFQIPFSLPSMQEDGFKQLIEDVITSRGEVPASPPRPDPSAQGAQHQSMSGAAPGGQASTGPTVPAPTSPPTPSPSSSQATGAVEATPSAAGPGAGATQQQAATSAQQQSQGQAAPAGAGIVDSAPVLEDWEKRFLQALFPFVNTPRLAKRLVNIYRLLRVRSGTMDGGGYTAFIERDSGEYRAVQVLLALNIGYPEIARPLFRRVAESSHQRWDAFLDELLKECNPSAGGRFPTRKGDNDCVRAAIAGLASIRHALAKPPSPVEFPDDMTTYRRWAPEVERYLFHWNVS